MIYNFKIYYIYLTTLYSISHLSKAEDDDLTFPTELIIGAGTSSYQIEGGWNASDKGEGVWDYYTHNFPNNIVGRENGDISCDSYHQYQKDVQLLKQIGVNYYRFSISWPRILPTGYSNKISKDGIAYYNSLINELIKNDVEPYVTIYHFDHPQIFQEIGGWTNEAMVDLFADYARVVFREFGDRVKMFSTINEPHFCEPAYVEGYLAPGLKIGKHASYLCAHNVLKAHARAYHIYNDEFRAEQKGKVGIILGCSYHYAKDKNDNTSAEIAAKFDCDRYASPIFTKAGDYPEIVRKRIAENSEYEGLPRSRLPTFSREWLNYIKNTSDYFGLNHYTSQIVEPAPKPNNTIYLKDVGLLYSSDPTWPDTSLERIKIVPAGFRDLLKRIKKEFGNPPVYVMENGAPDDGPYNDIIRLKYLYSYMEAMLMAIKKDGCNVKAYTIWSLLDNFEWGSGYSAKFGLVNVNFKEVNRTRTLKKSAIWLAKVLRERKLHKPSL